MVHRLAGASLRRIYRDFSTAAFDLGVTVRAEQNALARLFSQSIETERNTPGAHDEPLLRGIQVMEGERGGMTVVPAQPATPPASATKICFTRRRRRVTASARQRRQR
jgi:hypothetical protein